ncbi:hypothetical protein JTE90_026737 [Oedothorax gibbosus]|uniref:Uncharacterized protein n=1 Tax=Oedothorax gibbosus TaxID=931172 RepID=A0AAV6U5Z1_9ARAC|nr:hypothetical protein JTE90_026737 [Oedothorax gibbosus]
MHSFYSASISLRVLHKIQFSKWLQSRRTTFLHNSEAIIPFLGPSSRIICTDSKRQLAHLNHQAVQETSLTCPITLLKDLTKVQDNPCLKLITLPIEYHSIEAYTKTSNMLPRSMFFYDVRLTGLSDNSLPFSGVYFYSFEGICDSSIYPIKSQNVLCDVGEVLMAGSSNLKENDTGRPTEDQLLHVINRLTHCLLGFFEKPQDFSIYHKNIVFQNNIKGVTIKGSSAYVQAMYLLRFYGYVQYAKIKVEILKITHHVEDGTVRVRWRVKGVSRHKVLLKLWKLKSMNWKQFAHEEAEWLDGFSVFSVGTDGLIYKHVCDKMTPNDDTVTAKKVDLKSRLLGLFELGPRGPAAGSLNALMPCQGYSSTGKKLT